MTGRWTIMRSLSGALTTTASRRRARGGGAEGRGGGACRSFTDPTAPVAASIYQGPVLPIRTADFGGIFGVALASNVRVSPGSSRLLVAAQRAWPDFSSSGSSSGRTAAVTPVRGASPPSSLATASVGAGWARSASSLAAVDVSTRPVRSPIRDIVTKQAKGGVPGSRSNATLRRSAGAAVRQHVEDVFLRGSACAAPGSGPAPTAALPRGARSRGCGRCRHGRTRPGARAPRGVMVVVYRLPCSSTTAVITSPLSRASTAPSRTRVRPRVSVRDSTKRPMSSEAKGVGMRQGLFGRGRRAGVGCCTVSFVPPKAMPARSIACAAALDPLS